ncbi:DoxX family protein [Paenibacillus alba]|uniref:DoxX family protein n=1 Tax=Paenibacillus alba TaxID=1197127 RepID=UPI001564F50F|nr:DoxX family protein [Paenibacillus alba]NQX71642.1 DoxX family protein [Paenibacillus alba]
MIPFYVLIVSFLLFKVLGLLGLSYWEGWHTALQGAVAAMFLLTASAHWGRSRQDLIRMVPSAFPKPDWLVTATGWLEIAGAVGILLPATSRVASICLALMLIAMFPANLRAAREGLTIRGRATPRLLVRTLLQLVFLAAVILAG